MAITDPFTFLNDARDLTVDVQSFTFDTPTDGDISLYVGALKSRPGGGVDEQSSKLANARFSVTEIVAAYQVAAQASGLAITTQQIGQLLSGGVSRPSAPDMRTNSGPITHTDRALS